MIHAILFICLSFQNPVALEKYGLDGELVPEFMNVKPESSWFREIVLDNDTKENNYFNSFNSNNLESTSTIFLQNYENRVIDVVVSLRFENVNRNLVENFLIRMDPYERKEIYSPKISKSTRIDFGSIGQFGIANTSSYGDSMSKLLKFNSGCIESFSSTGYCVECDRIITVENAFTGDTVIALLARRKGKTPPPGKGDACQIQFNKYQKIYVYYPLNSSDPYKSLFHAVTGSSYAWVCGPPECKMESYATRQVQTGRDLKWVAVNRYDSFDDVIFHDNLVGIAHCATNGDAICGDDPELFFYIY